MIIPECLRRLEALGSANASKAQRILETLVGDPMIAGVVIHGSVASDRADEVSDLDIIIVNSNGDRESSLRGILHLCSNNSQLSVLLCDTTDKSPWFGHLTTLVIESEPIFIAEIGVITQADVSNFYVEPSGLIVKDDLGILRSRQLEIIRLQVDLSTPQAIRMYEVPFATMLLKIDKSLTRGRVWNAIELLSQLRRLYIQFVKHRYTPDGYVPLGRPERDIEDFIDLAEADFLEATLPTYDVQSVRTAANMLATRITSNPLVRDSWRHTDVLRRICSLCRQ